MNNAGWQFSREEVNTSSGQGRPRQGPVSHTARGAGQGDRAAVGTCQLSQLGSRPRWSRGGCAPARGACGTWTQLSRCSPPSSASTPGDRGPAALPAGGNVIAVLWQPPCDLEDGAEDCRAAGSDGELRRFPWRCTASSPAGTEVALPMADLPLAAHVTDSESSVGG